MSELILTATDTVFHEINLKSPLGRDSEMGFMSRGSSRDSYRDHRRTSDSNAIYVGTRVANVDSEEEWDTDLEDEGYRGGYRYMRNEDPKHVYQAACKQLNIVPASRFLKGIETRTMNLNYQGLGPNGVRAVATGLIVDRVTTCLSLAGNFIGQDGVRYVCEMLRENDVITEVDLSENDVDTYGIRVLSEMFRINDTVIKLSLSGNRLKGTDAVYISTVLTLPLVFKSGHLHGLKILDLSHNQLGDEGARVIGHAIADNEVLTDLNVSWNQIRKPGILCLAKGIGDNNCLKKIDISTNGVSNEGAEALGKALEINRTLEEINLNSNRIGLLGVTALFASLAKNEKLRKIRLSNNPIGYQGPTAALQFLQESETSVLEEIEIADACVPREFFQLLEEFQLKRPQFKVHIGGCMDSKDMFKAEIKSSQESWSKDPTLVFINYIEEQRLRVVDMFKAFDTDRSLMVSVEEFKTGLTKIGGCPLSDKQLDQVIKSLDTDENGEIDIEEFFEGHSKHKKRLDKLLNYGSRAPSRLSSERAEPSDQWSRPSSRLSYEDNAGRAPGSRQSSATGNGHETNTPSDVSINVDEPFLEPPRPATTLQVNHDSNTEPLQDIVLPVPNIVNMS